MIVSADTLLEMSEFSGQNAILLQRKVNAIEQLIRAYTNNNFQNRFIRFQGKSVDSKIYGFSPFLQIGDTVQITNSHVNDGLYLITDIADDCITVDSKLFDVPVNLVTKVEYPEDIQSGVIELMKWEVKNRQKVGIKQETLSRHSVTYYDQDAGNQVMGYPVSLLAFLKPYMKARF